MLGVTPTANPAMLEICGDAVHSTGIGLAVGESGRGGPHQSEQEIRRGCVEAIGGGLISNGNETCFGRIDFSEDHSKAPQ